MNSRAPQTHELKTWPSQFRSLQTGAKLAEFRKNDRDFQVGDELVLREWIPGHAESEHYNDEDPHPGRYTGDLLRARVTHAVYGTETPFGIPPGYVMLSIHPEGLEIRGNVQSEWHEPPGRSKCGTCDGSGYEYGGIPDRRPCGECAARGRPAVPA